MINQLLLPHKFDIYESRNYLETADAIKSMIIRGAPAIGAAGAYGIAVMSGVMSAERGAEQAKAYLQQLSHVEESPDDSLKILLDKRGSLV